MPGPVRAALLHAGSPYVEAVLEEPPKWGLLKEVLEEVGSLKQVRIQ